MTTDNSNNNSIFMLLFGAWGKTGINCYLLITGYFMCTGSITFRKFFKLMGVIYFYRWIIYIIFFATGYETLTLERIIKLIMPVWDFKNNFTSCFIGFWLTIPFLNILVQNMTKHQHELLLLLMLSMFTILGSIPGFNVSYNYVIWFGIVYFVSSYIRLHPNRLFESKRLWSHITIMSIVLSIMSIIVMRSLYGSKDISSSLFFVSDCNKVLAVVVSVSSFLWIKNIRMDYSRLINALGAGCFGVFLIHANSDAMRIWLWSDVVNVVCHYNTMAFSSLAIYSVITVLIIFIVFNLIDHLRIATIEKWLLCYYDNHLLK